MITLGLIGFGIAWGWLLAMTWSNSSRSIGTAALLLLGAGLPLAPAILHDVPHPFLVFGYVAGGAAGQLLWQFVLRRNRGAHE